MDGKLYSEAMSTLDMDMEMFDLVADSITIQPDNISYTKNDYHDFYDILKHREGYSDDDLKNIIASKLGIITLMTATWADICKEKNRKIDKKEFCDTFLSKYNGE